MKQPRNPEVLVLLSGGIDSTAALHFYVTLGRPVVAMFVDYGQAAYEPERRAAESVSAHFGVTLLERKLLGSVPKSEGEVLMRNAYLIALAAMERPETVWGIAAGIHGGTPYPDCSETFAKLIQEIARLQTRPVEVLLPFLSWNKSDILSYCEAQGVPGCLTYSCERGEVPPCGECISCRDRKEFDARTAIKTNT